MLRRPDWRLLAVVTIAQVLTAAALRAVSIASIRAAGERAGRFARFLIEDSDDRLIWAIEATGRRLGRLSTCLVRALVAEVLLDPSRGAVILTIGVKRSHNGGLQGHAWVARNDRILIGGTADEYTVLVDWTT